MHNLQRDMRDFEAIPKGLRGLLEEGIVCEAIRHHQMRGQDDL
jgi:hypothetical protein